MISTQDCLWYVEEALDGMVDIVNDLGDDLAKRTPDLPDANSPFAILTHCLGVMEDWGGSYIAGRAIERDREAEFHATGSVDELIIRAERAREQLRVDLASFEPFSSVLGTIDPAEADLPFYRTQGGALIHIHEELAQHHGQMQITRALLRTSWVKVADDGT
jgi:hypothetical protein